MPRYNYPSTGRPDESVSRTCTKDDKQCVDRLDRELASQQLLVCGDPDRVISSLLEDPSNPGTLSSVWHWVAEIYVKRRGLRRVQTSPAKAATFRNFFHTDVLSRLRSIPLIFSFAITNDFGLLLNTHICI